MATIVKWAAIAFMSAVIVWTGFLGLLVFAWAMLWIKSLVLMS
jgi:hypothetical protein